MINQLKNTTNMNVVVAVNIIALLNIFNNKRVNIVNIHMSNTRPTQFEDQFGNLYYHSELSNFENLKIN
jgi:hypothetical protein